MSITYPPALLPWPDEDGAEVIAGGKVIHEAQPDENNETLVLDIWPRAAAN